MGNICSSNDANDQMQENMDISHFLIQSILGGGGFGVVMCGRYIADNQWYAIKFIKKANTLKMKSGISMLYNELNALKRLSVEKHPFISGVNYAFQDG